MVIEKERKIIWDPAYIAKRIHVPTYDEILEKIKGRYPKRSKDYIKLEITRLESTYNIAYSKTNFIVELSKLINSLDEFFWDLIRIEFDEDDIRGSLRCIKKARRLMGKFWERYRFRILGAEEPKEARKISKEGRGRILSTLKRCRSSLAVLRSLVVFLSKMPAIDPKMPTIIVSGAPSTGKSTFIRSVSSAQPKVSPYPFTTKEIKVGHVILNSKKIQVVDTPGLLDRPPEDMNSIEQKAVAALRRLRGTALLLIDVSPSATLPIESQFKIIDYLKSYLLNKPVYVGINKVDIADKDFLQLAEKIAKERKINGDVKDYIKLKAIEKESAMNIILKIYNNEFIK